MANRKGLIQSLSWKNRVIRNLPKGRINNYAVRLFHFGLVRQP